MGEWNPTTTLAAEFVGTFLLVFTIGCNIMSNNGTWGAVSIACVLMVTIYSFAKVSGSNFNPAVSFALGLMGKLPGGWPQVFGYMATQVVAACCAGLAYNQFFHGGNELKPKEGYAVGAIIAEFFFTFMLVFGVLNTAASKKATNGGGNQFYGMTIAFTIIAGAYGAGPLGAGCFNPAVAFGLFTGSMFKNFGWMFAYSIAELCGAFAACEIFKTIRPEEVSNNMNPLALNTEGQAPEEYPLKSQLIAEGVGTFMLVLTVGLNVLGQSKAGAFGIAAALMCMINNLGDVSGGHFNPAVTMTIHWCGAAKPNLNKSMQFMLAQIVGAVVAAFVYSLAYNGLNFPLGPGVGHTWTNAVVAEVIFTAVLCCTVLFTVMVEKPPAKEFTGFLIGSCVTVGGFAASTISGGVLNPAVAVGIAAAHILNGGLFFKAIIYSLAHFAGAGIAAGLFQVLMAEEVGTEKEKLKAEA
eukprot:TRINITY_DN91704_c0_g1_i1.p1 TRINITY_DN91704_c0_g1~~TRINITY_DN91704_c0_g1_i1.p1  ORF type:complete len:467 (+),score=131.09 TRINITY_DN91704_c0_g1_i1:125-1525(+)